MTDLQKQFEETEKRQAEIKSEKENAKSQEKEIQVKAEKEKEKRHQLIDKAQKMA